MTTTTRRGVVVRCQTLRRSDMADRTCSIDGCSNPLKYVSRGWCKEHYMRWYRTGDVTAASSRWPFPENLLRRLEPQPNGCVYFMGTRVAKGYGMVSKAGRMVPAHRAMYEFMVGPIPAGLTIDHLCGNPPCVNPGHLEPVTGRENTLRGDNPPAQNARKTHCIRGHEFSPENTYRRKSGGRDCLVCMSLRGAARYAAQVRGLEA